MIAKPTWIALRLQLGVAVHPYSITNICLLLRADGASDKSHRLSTGGVSCDPHKN
jgi:hypothetical protein